jgi:hypothetical protein
MDERRRDARSSRGQRRRLIPMCLIVSALCGCAESHMGGSLLYMTPYKLDELDCAELKKRATAAAARTRQIEELRDKANASAAGPLVNAMVYGPDYSKARWEQQLYDDALARKQCDAPPPAPLPPRN